MLYVTTRGEIDRLPLYLFKCRESMAEQTRIPIQTPNVEVRFFFDFLFSSVLKFVFCLQHLNFFIFV